MAVLSRFSVDDLEVFGRAIRSLGEGAGAMPAAAERITEYLDANLRDGSGSPSCVTVTLHISHRFELLPHDLQAAARAVDATADDGTACLVLAAVAASIDAARPATQVLPLTDTTYEHRPILVSMLAAMHLDRRLLADPTKVVLEGIHRSELEAFVVRDLASSTWVSDADRPTIEALGIDSLLTIGGGLPTGDVFLLSVFSHEPIPDRAAWLFRALAPAVKAALIPHALHPWEER